MFVRNKKGFTLIELMITTAIVSLFGLALYSTFSNGINVWKRANRSKSHIRTVRFNLEKISRKLRNTFKFSKIPFEGTKTSLSFPIVLNKNQEEYKDYGIGKVSYFFDKEENLMSKTKKIYPEIFKEREGETVELISHVKKLEFSYCYLDNTTGRYKWKDTWEKEEQESIPQAVKIKLSFKEPVVVSKKLTKTVFIPIGTGKQKITVGE